MHQKPVQARSEGASLGADKNSHFTLVDPPHAFGRKQPGNVDVFPCPCTLNSSRDATRAMKTAFVIVTEVRGRKKLYKGKEKRM